MDVSLIANGFMPTSSFTGAEPPTIIRGKNAVIRAVSGRARIENYPGSKDIGENYNIAAETLTGSLAWTSGSDVITGTGTSFTTQLHNGQMVLSDDEVFSVKRIVSDTSFLCDRPPTSTDSGKSAKYLPVLFEMNRQRGVIRRGNAITVERKDIIFAGDGPLFLNGVTTGFTATRRPKRLQRSSAGIYTEFAIGFDLTPPPPVITAATGGWKGMQAGKFSGMLSYWNSVTDGYSNPTPAIKKDGGGTDITIVAGGRLELDFTTSLVGKPANADGFVYWGSQSGGGVVVVNDSSFASGPWLKVEEIYTGAYTIVDADVDPATDKITIPGHKFKTAYSIFFNTTWGGLTADTEYFAIYVDANTIKVATTAANANLTTAINITADPGIGSHTVKRLNSADKTWIEYLDGELGGVASGDNVAPGDCEWVAEFANQVFCISALGNKTSSQPLGTSPGNYVLPMKANNKEAFPEEWRVSLGDEITGFANGVGRLFCLTPSGLPFVTPTGRTELARLAPTGLDAPFTSRPFWTKGGTNPYIVIVVQGDVFVYTGRTLLRSPSNADERNTVPFEIGLPVSDLTKEWFDGHVLLGHCPKNQQLCLISSATHRNDAGFWVSQILPLSLQKNEWQPVIELTSDTRDMIVSGVATVNGRMEFLAGGRAPAGAFTMSTFRYDEPTSGTPVPYYIAFTPSDLGEEQRQKSIKSFRVTGRVADGIIQVHGARAGEDISIADIENGTNSLSGNISVPDSTGIERQFKIRHLVKGLQIASVRFAGEWDGTGDVDRLDEIVLDVEMHGIKQ